MRQQFRQSLNTKLIPGVGGEAEYNNHVKLYIIICKEHITLSKLIKRDINYDLINKAFSNGILLDTLTRSIRTNVLYGMRIISLHRKIDELRELYLDCALI
ncbi:hypothetical protein EGW08_006665 [Elysia chlorotica]|uniref:Uncharacterized protein n=1 Tax=Elysia chlorotica TaxID=188477 RepID=A0A3S0ZS81_ELYCH|nr:hypothetical protein EGW08_006665 [Elysia chlorotica]